MPYASCGRGGMAPNSMVACCRLQTRQGECATQQDSTQPCFRGGSCEWKGTALGGVKVGVSSRMTNPRPSSKKPSERRRLALRASFRFQLLVVHTSLGTHWRRQEFWLSQLCSTV